MKARASRIQPTKKASENAGEGAPGSAARTPGAAQAPAAANAGFRVYQAASYRVEHPAEWKVYEAGEGAVTAAPADGIVHDRQGNPSLARGLMAGFFAGRQRGLSAATDELIADLRRSNPGLEILRGQRQGTRLGGAAGRECVARGGIGFGGAAGVCLAGHRGSAERVVLRHSRFTRKRVWAVAGSLPEDCAVGSVSVKIPSSQALAVPSSKGN